MIQKTETEHLGIGDRIRRSQGRQARNTMAAAKVTREERLELAAAAEADGKAFSEWAREALLKQARAGATEGAIFTEVVALRMQLNIVLRSIALGEKMTPDSYTAALNEVRTGKHKTSQELLRQYATPAKEQ